DKKIQLKLEEQKAQIAAKEQEITQILENVALKRREAQYEIKRIAAETEDELMQTLKLKQQELSENIEDLEDEQNSLEKQI
ncbi:hypothetical protein, partial [Vibrio parahaemolyticus]|uniref:hypothetical protein n=1 Tax=Vibrio parahaemolyticus TaxID=670 RepID=UPI0021134CAA